MLIFVLGCYLAAIAIAVLVMIIPPKLTYRYDNGYYSCIGHYGIKDRCIFYRICPLVGDDSVTV